jgi:hypothetical protein
MPLGALRPKIGKIAASALWSAINNLAYSLDINLEQEVMKKMAKNEKRPQLYGVAK